MKTIKFICACFLVTTSFFVTSCSSDDDGGGSGSAAAGTITAKVDGNNVTTLEMTTFANQVGSMLSIQGNTGGTSSKAIVLNITTFDGVGTYDIGGTLGLGQANASYTEITVDISNPTAFESKIWSAPYEGGDKVGEINVSEVTETNIKGTFTFSAKNTDDNSMKQITQGSFNVELN
ncbi:DUF6252 family protein [Flavobacterium sp.]|jgi:hypothetical protein|uniref:DUF6252 family protein n=1 Tax=Flavobacterium sp. TaxID=239 RepID=UPI0037C0A97C